MTPASINRFLNRLPASNLDRLGLLQPIELAYDQVIYQDEGTIEFAYFPTTAVLSALTVMRDGSIIEVATVGREGLVGHYGFNGRTSPHRVVVQVAGQGYRVESRALEREAARGGELADLLSAYHIAFMSQVSQSVACNGLHGLAQRCCRWLLMSRDRVGSDDIRLTQDYLAAMLGTRRASVTDVIGPLRDGGLIRSQRGLISIVNGPALEERACECYAVVRDRYDRLLGPDLRA